MATLAALRTTLKETANVVANDRIADSLVDTFITQSLAQHNPLYTIASLPAREEEAVMLLAWIKVCLKRANNVISEQTAHGPAGFNQDRETPYRKNMAMVDSLRRQYNSVCASLGLVNNGVGVTTGNISVMDDRVDAITPLSLEPNFGPLVLTVTQSTSQLSIFDLSWNFTVWDNFDSVTVFMAERATTEEDETLLQEWNYSSDTGVPRILNGAEKLVTISRADQRVVRVTQLDPAKRHRFLAVLRSRSGHYVYSEESYTPGLFEEQGSPAYTWTVVADMSLGNVVTSANTHWAGEQVQPASPKGQAMALGDYMLLYLSGSFSPQTGKYAVSLPGCALITDGNGGGSIAGATNTATAVPYLGLSDTAAEAEAAALGLAVFATQTISPAVTGARIGAYFADPGNYNDNTAATSGTGTAASDWTLYRKVLSA